MDSGFTATRRPGMTKGGRLQAKLAVRAEANKLKAVVIRLPIDQHQVRPDVAVAAIVPLAGERMIEVAARQLPFGRQYIDGLQQQGIEGLAMRSGLLPLVIALEAVGVFNRPHASVRAACREEQRW